MIQIIYDSSGNVLLIHIEINSCLAQIPWNPITQTIEWDLIDYAPTRTKIEEAWNAWAENKDLSVELAARPDLAPSAPKSSPNWNAFNLGLIVLAAYNNLMLQIPGYLSGNLSVIAGQFATGNFSDYATLKSLWDSLVGLAINKPTAADIDALNHLAKQNNMPFSFEADGMLLIA